MKFDKFIESCFLVLKEQETGDVDTTAQQPATDASQQVPAPTPQQPDPNINKTVSQGYAYMVGLIYELLKYNTKNINPKFFKLSDNEITNSKQAYRYIEILSKLLPENTVSSIKNLNFSDEEQKPIDLDDSTTVEMANIAIKSLFYSPKDNLEFISKIDDIQNIVSKTGNKIDIKNANSIYIEIKNFVGMEQ